MNKRSFFIGAFLLLCGIAFSLKAETAKEKKVLFIGIDGCRWEAIAKTDSAPYLKDLMSKSWTCTNALAETPTWSSNGWAALLTGVNKEKHGWVLNEYGPDKGMVTYVSFFQHLKAEHPDMHTASFSSWPDINNKAVRGAATVVKNSTGANSKEQDLSIYNAVMEELQRDDAASVIFVQLNDVDSQGHSHGFTPETPEYLNALGIVDDYIKNMIDTVKARKNYANEDWLFIVTTDHGGNQNGHGGSSYEEQNVFFILNNEAIEPSLLEGAPETKTEMHDYAVNTLNFGEGISADLPNMEELGFNVDGSFTIEMRIRATKQESEPVIFGNKDWTGGAYTGFAIVHDVWKDFRLHLNLGDGSDRLDLTGSVMGATDDKDWIHASFVIDRTAQRAYLYEGGTLMASGDISNIGSMKTNLPYRLGTDSKNHVGGYFDGNVAELRIFNKALAPETLEAYAAKPLDAQHPDLANLVMYNPGNDGEGNTYKGALGKPDITFTTTGDATLTWGDPGKQLIGRSYTDYKGAPHLYDLAPTIFNFLGFPARAGYQWDGKTMIEFNPVSTEDELPAATDDLAVLDDFENGRINYAFQPVELGFSFEVVDNPAADAVNGSDKVLKCTRIDKSHIDWACFYADLSPRAYTLMDFDQYPYLSYKVYRTVDGGSVKAKCETSTSGKGNTEIFPENEPTKVGEWEEVYFPMQASGASGQYRRLTIMPDWTTNHDAGVVVYIDDICMKTEVGNDDYPTTGVVEAAANDKDIQVYVNGGQAVAHFLLPQDANVLASVYTPSGMQVYHAERYMQAGWQEIVFPIADKGVYLLTLNCGGETFTVKFVH